MTFPFGIQRNIFAFGGDPTRITLAGQDAGAVSALVQLDLAIPELEEEPQLFHRVILQSAGIQHPWSYVDPREAFRRSLQLASLLGCPTQGSTKQDVILCLTRKDADDILAKEMGVAMPGLNFFPFVVTADGKTVTDEPRKMLRQGIFQI
jgi:carboxylesterase type B